MRTLPLHVFQMTRLSQAMRVLMVTHRSSIPCDNSNMTFAVDFLALEYVYMAC